MSLELLSTWRDLLGELGELGGALARSVEADDVLGAVAAMAQLRRVRSAIARVEAPARVAGDLDELAAIQEVSALTAGARSADAVMQRWLARPLPGDARLLATPLGAAVLADVMLPAVWDFEADVVVLVGAGLEPAAEVLCALGQRRIVIVDGDPAANLPGAIATHSVAEVTMAVRTMVPGPPTQAVVRAAMGVDPELVEQILAAVRATLGDLRIHRNTVRAFSKTWIEQGTSNLSAVARWPSIAAVGASFAGTPMVIVAPGPSLANNVDQLRALKGRAIITAFSHSLKPVLAAGVVPDLVVTVDPQDVRYHFEGCDLAETCLVNAVTVHPSLFELGAPRCLTLSANCAIDDWIFGGLGEDAVVPGGGSVATTAFSLALRWGCDPIVFVGLDLSFSNGAYYVATSSDGGARAGVDERGVMRVDGWSSGFRAMKAGGGPAAATERAIDLPGWNGGRVPSSFMFGLFHRWFVDRMKHVVGTAVFNCTEGGAWIDGMEHARLADVAPRLASAIDIRGVLDAAIASVDEPTRSHALAGHIQGFAKGLALSRLLATRARDLIASGDTERRLEAVERNLVKALRPLTFLSLLAQRELDRAQDVARRAGLATDYLDASASLFATLVDVIDQVQPGLAGALQRLDQRRSHGSAA